MGLVLFYEESVEGCWVHAIFIWEIHEWEIHKTDAWVGGGNGLNIGGGGGGDGGFCGAYTGMHEEDGDGEALLFLKEAFG